MKCLIPYFAGKLPLYLSESEGCRPGLSPKQHFSEHRMLTVCIHGAMLVPAGSKDKFFMLLVHIAILPTHSGQICAMCKVYKLLSTVRSALVLSLLINKLKINYITKIKYKLGNINIHSAVHASSLSCTVLIWWSFQFMQSMACVLPKIPEIAFSENIGRAK